jgi:hypothetical protein
MRLIGVLLVVAGCHFEGGTMSPDSATEPDVPPQGGLGVSLSWNASPALPGPVTDKVTVTDATFELERLQLVSDAGADGRTTRSRYQLVWNAAMTPPRESFPDAPVAVYQRISVDLRPDILPPSAYQIQGVWRDEDELKPFRVADPAMLDIPIDCSVSLPAGGSVSIAVKVDLRDALNSIDFRTVPEINGVLLLSGGPQLGMFRNKLLRSFSSDD